MSRPIQYTMTRVFPLPRTRVWELLSDTDHLNRLIGLFPVSFGAPGTDHRGMYRVARARGPGGLRISWREYPFEWVANETYSVVREYEKGPLRRFRGGVRLRDDSEGSGGTEVELFGEFTPAGLLGRVGARVGRRSMHLTFDYVEKALALGGRDHVHAEPAAGRIRVQAEEAERLFAQLPHTCRGEAAASLKRHLLERGDDDVADMQPYVLADRWGTVRRETLSLFLHATRVGLLSLRWELICPHCRVAKDHVDTLSALPTQFTCDFCGLSYTPDFDRYIELRFSVHPAVRRADRQIFCVGGPAISPHIRVQAYIPSGETRELQIPDEPEGLNGLQLRVLKRNRVLRLVDVPDAHDAHDAHDAYDAHDAHDAHPISVPFMLGPEGWQREQTAVRPGSVLTIANTGGEDAVVALERVGWDPGAVTAAEVTAMPEFRALFASEVLAPGHQVGISSVTLLFSDLQGSTSFYERVGDARAYGHVRSHFEFIRERIERHRGSIVKTIGDSVMAVFLSAVDGWKAACDIQAEVEPLFNEGLPDNERMVIKIGLHEGPAIVVNANGTIDYFGQTVNIASRIQSCSAGRDIVVPRAFADVPEICEQLRLREARLEPFEAQLKGIENKLELLRIRV